MPCYHPMLAYRSPRTSEGKSPVKFAPRGAYVDLPLQLPCGKCIGCRLEKARQWAIRCIHEASLYEKNCFITLTYDPKYLPEDGSLQKIHFQNFMKYLRRDFGEGIRFYACGEYGKSLLRPHYHAVIFNFDFPDKYIFRNGKVAGTTDYGYRMPSYDYTLYRSPSLERLWNKGFSTIGALTMESAGYVARYISKKMYGEVAEDYYHGLTPEFSLMSRRPGIGREWFEKYSSDVYPKDYFTVRGVKHKPPRYYDNVMEGLNPELLRKVKNKRTEVSIKKSEEDGVTRIFEREKVKQMQTKQLIRRFENES